jgi:hypothetical protein
MRALPWQTRLDEGPAGCGRLEKVDQPSPTPPMSYSANSATAAFVSRFSRAKASGQRPVTNVQASSYTARISPAGGGDPPCYAVPLRLHWSATPQAFLS